MAYLICYQQWTGKQFVQENNVTLEDPVDWLVDMDRRFPEARTVLLSVFEVPDEKRKTWEQR